VPAQNKPAVTRKKERERIESLVSRIGRETEQYPSERGRNVELQVFPRKYGKKKGKEDSG